MERLMILSMNVGGPEDGEGGDPEDKRLIVLKTSW